MSVLRKLASDTAIYGLSSILGRMLNYILVPFHTRVMSAGDYGVVSYLYASAAILMVVLTYRLETAYFRFASDKNESELEVFGTAFWGVVGAILVFVSGLLWFAPEVATFMGYPGKALYVQLFAGVVAFDVLSEMPLSRLRKQARPLRFAASRLLMIAVNIIANVLFLGWLPYAASHSSAFLHSTALQWSQTNNLVACVFWANLIASGAMFFSLLPVLFQYKLPFNAALWRRMLGYAAPLIVVGLAGIVNESLDRFLLLQWLPGNQSYRETQLGIYSGCYKLAMLVSLFTQAYRYAVEPFFFGQAQNAEAEQRYATVSRYYTWAGAFAFAAVMLYLPWLQFFVAKSYRDGLNIVPLLLGANIFLGLYYNVSVWYRVKDKTLLGSFIAVGGAGVTLAANFFLIPIFGFYGAALTHLITYMAMTFATAALGRRYMRIPYAVGRMSGYIFSALVVWQCAKFTDLWLAPTFGLQFLLRTAWMGLWIFFWLLGPERSVGRQIPVLKRFLR